MFLAVIEHALAALHARLDAALGGTSAAPDDIVERLVVVARTVFELYDAEPDKAALIFSEGGLSIRMLRGSEGRTLMTLPGMVRLVERIDTLFQQGCRHGPFRGIDPVAGREAYFGIIEGTILAGCCPATRRGLHVRVSAQGAQCAAPHVVRADDRLNPAFDDAPLAGLRAAAARGT